MLLTCLALLLAATQPLANTKADGYRGIWFTLGERTEHGDKYSGGLATYTANHVPIAIYAPKVNKTFFVYGGTIKDQRHLLIMASYYYHATNKVPRPTIVHDKLGVSDPHDNASLCIDGEGYLWIFVSGRARARPGFIYRSTAPYSVDAFKQIAEREQTYPQPHYVHDLGFLHLFTKYTAGRELYWETSRDGVHWDETQKLAGFGGHYQVSATHGNLVATSFMWHPNGDVNKRTNLYYAQSSDFGRTWTTITGEKLETPLRTSKNPALLIDYQAQKLNVYIHDLNFDADGHPVILYLTSHGAAPGAENAPYTWRVTRWTGSSWRTTDVCTSDHNYDTGCLHIARDRWTIIGPTDPGPTRFATGGEMVVWRSEDHGTTWKRAAQITADSKYNHSYARRPLDATDPFFAFWADGDADHLSPSHLYFGDSQGRAWQLPYDMLGDFDAPTPLH